MMRTRLILFGLLLAAAPLQAVEQPNRSQSFLLGQAVGLLCEELYLHNASVAVSGKTLIIGYGYVNEEEKERIRLRLLSRTEAEDVIFVSRNEPLPRSVALSSRGFVPIRQQSSSMFNTDRFFQPLLADPRWPHMYAIVRFYIDDPDFNRVGAMGIGETALFHSWNMLGGRAGLGLQASGHLLFQLGVRSDEHVNADYMFGPFLTSRFGPLTAMMRLWHQSSHTGDEFLLNSGTGKDSIGVSFEILDLLVSYNFLSRFRVYGGGGYAVGLGKWHSKRWVTQAGLEYRGPLWVPSLGLRPWAAVDVKSLEENGWDIDTCVRAGVQLESLATTRRQAQVVLEYYHGHDPNGFLFPRISEYYGIGLQFFL